MTPALTRCRCWRGRARRGSSGATSPPTRRSSRTRSTSSCPLTGFTIKRREGAAYAFGGHADVADEGGEEAAGLQQVLLLVLLQALVSGRPICKWPMRHLLGSEDGGEAVEDDLREGLQLLFAQPLGQLCNMRDRAG